MIGRLAGGMVSCPPGRGGARWVGGWGEGWVALAAGGGAAGRGGPTGTKKSARGGRGGRPRRRPAPRATEAFALGRRAGPGPSPSSKAEVYSSELLEDF